MTGGRALIDRALKRADILIEDTKIVNVGTVPDGAAVGAKSVDATGLTILPGLIDAHAHLAIAEDRVTEARLAIAATRHAREFLRAGITSVRDVGGSRHVDIALRDAIAEGAAVGPFMQCAGRPIVMTGGHGHMLYRVADGVEDVTRAVREQLAARADLIKVMCSGGVFESTESEAWVQFTDAELSALIAEAKAQGRPVAAHAHPAAAIRRAVELGVDSIEHGSYVDPESAELMAARNVPMIPTFTVYKVLASHPGYPGVNERAKRVYDSKFSHFLDARSRGMPWGVGSDYSDLFSEPDSLIDEIGILSGELGIPLVDVIVAATEKNAEIMGLATRVGKIAVGKDADLIGVRGDPLADVSALRNVEFTVSRGVLYDWRN